MEQWLEERGSICLLLAGFLYGLNIPCPLGILLMAAGGLAREGVLPWPAVILCVPIGIFLGEQPWFFLGRRMGLALLLRMARFSRDPAALVQKITARFQADGPRLLLSGRFIPGIPAVVVPLAGMTGVGWGRFFAWDLASALLYTVAYSVCGNVLSQWFSLGEIVGGAIVFFVVMHLLHRLLTRRPKPQV